MTLSTTTSRADYTGTGSTGPFTVPFRFTANSDLTVIKRVIATGVETVLTLTTDYTVSGAGNATGAVTLVVALGNATETLSILRVVALTQPTSIANGGTFFPSTHEAVFDRLTMVAQQHEDALNRAVKVSATTDPGTVDMTSPAPVANQALGYNSDGTAIALIDVDGKDAATLTSANAHADTAVSAEATARASAVTTEATTRASADTAEASTRATAVTAAIATSASDATTKVAAEATLARNASNLSGGTVASARVAGVYGGITGIGDASASAIRTKGVPHFDVTNSSYGAKLDGSTDDRAAFASAETDRAAAGHSPVYHPGGPAKIGSALSLGDYEAAPGAILAPTATAQLAFTGTIKAGAHQILDLSSGAPLPTFNRQRLPDFRPEWLGAVGDALTVTDGAMTSGNAALTSASGLFTAAHVGKVIAVAGAGAAGVPLATTISAYVSPTQVTLAATASTTVTGATAGWGTDNSVAFTKSAAIAAAANVQLRLMCASYIASFTAVNNLRIAGSGYSDYEDGTSANATTRILRLPSATGIITADSVRQLAIYDIDFDGLGAKLVTASFGVSLTGANMVHLERVKIRDLGVGAGSLNSGTPCQSFSAYGCVFRECGVGSQFVQDSEYLGCTFSACVGTASLYLNNGQIRVSDCFFEWNRTATGGAVPGILLYQNANEVIITGCQFDRNGGQSILIQSSTKNPKYISITNNLFKRCGWGTSGIADATRCSIRVASTCEHLTVVGNTWQRSNHQPSTVEGLWSPLFAMDLGTSVAVTQEGNNWSDLGPLDLSTAVNATFAWALSAHGTNEYYLKDTASVLIANDPYIAQPGAVTDGATGLAAGTLGSLAVGQWAWGDNDTLGFSTVYVRVASGVAPAAPLAYYGLQNDSGTPSNYKTEGFRDALRMTSVAAGTTVSATFQTRMAIATGFERYALKLRVWGDEAFTTKAGYFEFPIVLNRAGALGDITVIAGTAATLMTGGFTGGFTGAGTTLTIAVTAAPYGGAITVAFTNNGANRLDLQAHLVW